MSFGKTPLRRWLPAAALVLGAALPAAGLCGAGGGRDPGDGAHRRRSLRHGVHGGDHPAG